MQQFREYKYNNLVELMLHNPTGMPETKALYVDSHTGESITFFHLKRLVGCINAGLARLGLKKGDAVCVYSPNHINMPPIYLGTMAGGVTISPANTSYVATELQRQLEISRAKILIAHPQNLETAFEAARLAKLPAASVFVIERDPKSRAPLWSDVLVDYDQPERPPIPMTYEDSRNTVAYLCFSSGTTGKSKGVMTSHHNCIAVVQEGAEMVKAWEEPQPPKTLLAVIPLYHFAGIGKMINGSIPGASTVVIVGKYSVAAMCKAIQDFKVTDLSVAPPLLIHLANNPIVNQYDLSSVQTILCGSAPVSGDIVRRVMKKFNIQIVQGYGMTEVAPVITYQLPDFAVPESVGRLVPFMSARFIDAEGRDVPEGQPGELIVKGPNVMIGYQDNPEATAGAIDKDGWLHTGDIMRVDKDGNFFIVDRVKELIKYKGFQVAPVELESILLQCPYVVDAGVFGIYDESQATEIPRAFVVIADQYKNENHTNIEKKVQDWVNERVANHKRLRGGVKATEAIPKSDAGKILRKKMVEMHKKQVAQSSNRASRL